MGKTLLILIMAAVSASLVLPASAQPSTSDGPLAGRKAAVVPLQGEINDYSKRTLIRNFERAREAGADTVILDIDTYGGHVGSALEISHFIKRSDLRVIAYVNSKAISAGALISVACDEIVMAPVATLGDCAPIAVGPGGGVVEMSEVSREKSETLIRADFRDSAMRSGHDPLLLESMVTLGRVVHYVEKDQQRRFVGAEDYAGLIGNGWKAVEGVPNPVDAANTLLTVNSDLAVKLGIARGEAGSAGDIASQRGMTIITAFKESSGEKLLEMLNGAAVRGILFAIFMTALYAAFHMPGHGAPEVVATGALAILMVVPLMTGYGQWWEVAAILFGVVLLAVEIFVLPGFGVCGVGGVLLILAGFLMTFVAPEPGKPPVSFPSLPASWAGVQRGLMVLVSGLIISLFASAWLRKYLPKLPMARRMLLHSPVGGSEEAMVGSLNNIDPDDLCPAIGGHGRAVTDLLPGGTAEFRDAAGGAHSMSVVSDSGFIPRGADLVVLESKGSRVVVRKATAEEARA